MHQYLMWGCFGDRAWCSPRIDKEAAAPAGFATAEGRTCYVLSATRRQPQGWTPSTLQAQTSERRLRPPFHRHSIALPENIFHARSGSTCKRGLGFK